MKKECKTFTIEVKTDVLKSLIFSERKFEELH